MNGPDDEGPANNIRLFGRPIYHTHIAWSTLDQRPPGKALWNVKNVTKKLAEENKGKV